MEERAAPTTPEALHPGVVGRQTEMGALARAVRRLVLATVLNRAEAAEIGAIAAELDDVAERLERRIPAPRPSITASSAEHMRDGATMAAQMAFDVVIGPYSPLALPVEITFDPPRALARAVFTSPYEGPRGCVHGAVLAATFDIVLTAANLVAGTPGLTVSLTTKFWRPTLLDETVEFEAWVDRADKRRVYTHARTVQRGSVTVEAEGVFAPLGAERSRTLARDWRSANSTDRVGPDQEEE